jgi:DNA mismatch repair ATPase MutS
LTVALSAAGCLLQYARDTQRASLPHIQSLRWEHYADSLLMDAASRRNLELDSRLIGKREHTLVNLLDQCATSMGGRLLRRWLHRPLRDTNLLQTRLDSISNLLTQQSIERLYQRLKSIGDIERILARIALRSARPRDLVQLRTALEVLPELQQDLKSLNAPLLIDLAKKIGEFPELHNLLSRAIIETPPQLIRDGGVIASGYDEELDELRTLSENAGQYLVQLEQREREQTGISHLKVGFNKVQGYFIEISRTQTDKVPAHYNRRQTLKAAERYITPELKEFEDKILGARERALNREKYLYELLLDELLTVLTDLQHCSTALAELDVLNNFAERADTLRFYPPEFSKEEGLHIIEGRHPVVEAVQETPFIPNDLQCDRQRRMLIITGANMGGKCLASHNYVFTSRGLLPIQELMPALMPIDSFVAFPSSIAVKSLHNITPATHFYHGGWQKTLKIKTHFGFSLEGTLEHRIWVNGADGTVGWRCLEDLTLQDTVVIDAQLELWGKCTAIDTSLAQELLRVKDRRLCAKEYALPTQMTTDLAYLLGLLTAGGYIHDLTSVVLETPSVYIATQFRRLVKQLFNYPMRSSKTERQQRYRIASQQIRMFLNILGLGYYQTLEKRVPRSILQAPRQYVIAFLHGLFDIALHLADFGQVVQQEFHAPLLTTPSEHLVQEVQLLLLNLGIVSAITDCPDEDIYCLRMIGMESVQRFNTLIKQYQEKQAAISTEPPAKRYFYDRVVSIQTGEADVFDLNVPNGHAFVANGFVSHNSTYIRQTALIVLLAHIGSFVPAQQAIIGPIDGIFTRIGASDDLAGGRSTFMVEMTETANILHNATRNSLVLMDEVGRGTSTFDGLALAWACTEQLALEIGAYTLFATHYFELTRLPELYKSIVNVHLDAVEQGEHLVFMHAIKTGPANKSYGLQVALLAGIPKKVVNQAKKRLLQLEAQQMSTVPQQTELVLSTSLNKEGLEEVITHPVLARLESITPDNLTPKQALELLYQLKTLL